MRKMLANTIKTLLVIATAVLLIACAQNTARTEEGQPAAEAGEGIAEAESPTEDDSAKGTVSAKESAPSPTIEASGQWSVYAEVTGGLRIWDTSTGEELEFDELEAVYELLDVKEYDDYSGNHDKPSSLHVTFADGFEGDVTNADAVLDLWERIMWSRVSPDLVAVDPGTFESNEFAFTWDDGRTQTYTYKAHTALAVDGFLYPLMEGSITSGEVFNGPAISRPENPEYPETLYKIARMMAEDNLGKRDVIIVRLGTSWMDYTEDSFTWDDGESVWGPSTYTVKHVQKTDDAPGGILLKKGKDDGPSCVIEGAKRLFVVWKQSDDDGPYLDVTYQPEDAEGEATCTVRLKDGELVASYQ